MTNEKTIVIGKDKNIRRETLKRVLSKVGLGAAGVAGGIGLSSFFVSMPKNANTGNTNQVPTKPDVNGEMTEVTSVTDEMSFSEAFQTARQEAGAQGYFTWHGKVFNTMYKEEQDLLSPQERQEMYANVVEHQREADNNNQGAETPVIIVHDEAPQASHVNDDMSFKDAFAIAREEVGPGGIFEWHGKLYNTYTREEFGAMTSEQKQEYVASTQNASIESHEVGAKDVDIVSIDGGDTTMSLAREGAESTHQDEEMLQEQWVDDGTGHKVHVAEFLLNGEYVVKIDQDGDGAFDLTMKQNDDGSVHLQTADGQEADMTTEDFAQFQQFDGTQMDAFASTDDQHLNDVSSDFNDYNNNIV